MMNGMMMTNRKIFFSYSWKDMEVAMRLYDDLTRSHLNVWRDQIDGDPTADFLEEFLAKIDVCDDFVILDSKNYRKKSNWCLTEIERCLENRARRKGPRVIVCLLDKDDEWRNTFRNEKEEKLFSKVNMFKYHTLYYDGKYDNEDIYQQSLTAICNLFSERFIPWNCLPPNRDILEELSASEAQITDVDRSTILNGYEYIARFITLQRDVDKHFQLWISDCNYLRLNLFFPRWTYCVWLGHDMHQNKYDQKCFDEFEKLSKEFPNDPRCYRGLGCIAARLEKNDIAINAFEEALKLMEKKENSWHKKNSELEVLSNLGQVYINLGQFANASNCLAKAHLLMESQKIFELRSILNYILCLIMMEQFEKCKQLLQSLIETHPLENELYTELGNIYSKEGNNTEAISCFEHAYALAPSIQNAFYLLCRKSILHDISNEAILVLQKNINSLDDYYWKGAICFYLLQDIKHARLFYNISGGQYEWYQ